MARIAQGFYTAVAKAAELGWTKGAREQIAVLFELLDGDCAGAEITWYGYFTEYLTSTGSIWLIGSPPT